MSRRPFAALGLEDYGKRIFGAAVAWPYSDDQYVRYSVEHRNSASIAELKRLRDFVRSPAFTAPYDDAYATLSLSKAKANADAVWEDAKIAYIWAGETGASSYDRAAAFDIANTFTDIGLAIFQKAQQGWNDGNADRLAVADAQARARAAGVALRRAIEEARKAQARKRVKGARAALRGNDGQSVGSILATRGIERASQDVLRLLISLADEINVDADWLASVISFESGWNPAARNKFSRATGLIQFMPATAQRLGTTVDDLINMSDVEQMPFVRQYYLPFSGKLHNLEDTYLAVFYPAAIGKSNDWVVGQSGSAVYKQNAGFDKSGKGYITRGDIVGTIQSVFNNAGGRRVQVTGASVPAPADVTQADVFAAAGDQQPKAVGFGIGLALGVAGWYAWENLRG